MGKSKIRSPPHVIKRRSKMEEEGSKRVPPVTLDQVLGLVKYIASIGGKVDSSRLDEMLNIDMDLLPHVVEAAVTLGLLREDDGYLVITEDGSRASELSGRELRLLIRRLGSNVEPFKEIMARATGDSISRSELVEVIRRLGYARAEAVADIFSEWLAYMGFSVME